MRAYGSLRRQGEFARLYRRGRRSVAAHFMLYSFERRSGVDAVRVGISISKAVGKAVARNLVRRRIQGTLDATDLRCANALDLLIVAKPGAAELAYAEVAAQIRGTLGAVLAVGKGARSVRS